MFKNKGFYEEWEKLRKDNPNANFDFLKDISVTFSKFHIQTISYLYRLFVIFAYALHKEFGYEIHSVYYKKDLVHCYCVIPNEEEPIYVDVRGCTTDFALFIDDVFKYATMVEFSEVSSSNLLNIREETEYVKGEMDRICIKEEDNPLLFAAKEIIREHRDYYQI